MSCAPRSEDSPSHPYLKCRSGDPRWTLRGTGLRGLCHWGKKLAPGAGEGLLSEGCGLTRQLPAELGLGA